MPPIAPTSPAKLATSFSYCYCFPLLFVIFISSHAYI